MSGNQPSGGQPGPYGNQPNGPQQPPQGPGYQGPQGPQYQGPGYGGQQPGPQGQPYPSYPPGGPNPSAGSPGTPSYTSPVYGSPTQGPGQPGQPPSGPQTPYGFQPGQPGQPGGPGQPPPQKSGNTKTFIIIGAVVLALIVVGIGVGLLVRRTPTTTNDPGTTGPSTGGGQSSAPQQAPGAPDQAAAAKAYLEALATGKADAILATLDRPPVDKTFMTDAVLAQSIKAGPITAIAVSEPTSEYSSSVDADYKIGDTPVTASIRVVKQGDGWKVREGFNQLDLRTAKARTLPMNINGVAVATNTVRLFPGSYQFTTGAKFINYGDESTLIVESPSDYPRGLSDIEPTLTSAGEKAFISAVKDSVDKCLESKKLANPGCPNDISSTKGLKYKYKDGTLKWRLSGSSDPYSNMKVRLDYENPARATSYIYLSLRADGKCNAPSGNCYVIPYGSPKPYADMTKESVKITWVKS